MMKEYYKYIKELFKLAIPIVLGSVGMMLIGASDIFVAGRYSTKTLASVGIANSLTTLIFFFGIGILIGISPLLSNFRGEKNSIKKYFVPTVIFSQILAAISSLLILSTLLFIDKLGFSRALLPSIKTYIFILSFSTFGAYLKYALKEYLQAFEIVIFPNILTICGVILHFTLDFIFVFGLLGSPKFGTIGIAIASLFSRSFLGLVMLAYCLKFIKIRFYKDALYFVKLLKIGLPIAIAMILEMAAFYLVTVFIGKVSHIYAASQSILITVTTATFMVPVAISSAIAVKVGFANGAGNFEDVKKYIFSGTGVSVIFMTLCAFIFFLFPENIIGIFTKDLGLIKVCVPILILAGIFQIFDGIQVSFGGAFKGLKKTNIVMLGDFVAYWLIGLPLGGVLAFKYHMNLYGFWIGLTLAIIFLAFFFSVCLYNNFRIKKL